MFCCGLPGNCKKMLFIYASLQITNLYGCSAFAIIKTTPSLVSLRPLINERRNSTLMTRHFPDLGSTSDWLKQISHAVRSIRHTTHTQTHFCARFSDVISWGNQWWRRPRYKYHEKSPKYVSGNSRFFSKYLEKVLNISKISGFIS